MLLDSRADARSEVSECADGSSALEIAVLPEAKARIFAFFFTGCLSGIRTD